MRWPLGHHRSAFAGDAANVDDSAMQFQDRFHNRQSEAEVLVSPRLARAIQAVENMWQVSGLDPAASVSHGHLNIISFVRRCPLYLSFSFAPMGCAWHREHSTLLETHAGSGIVGHIRQR